MSIINDLAKIQVKKDIDKISSTIYGLLEDNEELRERLNEYSKDEEIQKLKLQIKEYRNHSLQQLTDKELELDKDFRNKHYNDKACGNGNDFSYRLIGTGIGTVIEITCNKCGETKDITDNESW